MNVVVVGDIITDILAVHDGQMAIGSDTAARIRIIGGGSAANTAAWLAFRGAAVTLVGVVGADEAGSAHLTELRDARVTCVVRCADDAATGTVVVLSSGSERTMLTQRGANSLLSTVDISAGLAAPARHLHLSGYTLLDPATREAGRHALVQSRERGLTTSVDAASAGPLRAVGGPAFLDWVRGADVLLANLDEARALLDRPDDADLLCRLLAEHAGVAVVKLGGLGALACDGSTAASVPARPAEAVDSTGAGDAFAAGFLIAWLAGSPLTQALDAGAELGAVAIGRHGGRP